MTPAAQTAEALHCWRCHVCGMLCDAHGAANASPPELHAAVDCPRCGSRVHARKPWSVARSWALLLAATALYIPANLLPVTNTSSIAGKQSDTIMSGIAYLWAEGAIGLAVLVFVASIAVPLTKLVALSYLLVSVQRHSGAHRQFRGRLYRMLEVVGRWSMLDIYVITWLSALVQIRSLATIEPGYGAVAFGAVVVLTMLATHFFDPRLIWDQPNQETSRLQSKALHNAQA